MSPNETQEVLSEDTVETSDNTKFVPMAQSIRYRKRAQSAEKKLEELTEQLAKAKTQTAELSEQLSDIQAEQKLTRKLATAGTNDLETALLIAKARLRDQKDADLDDVIEQLKNEKQYLFVGNSGTVTTQKTASAKERTPDTYTILAKAARKAATTGSRADLQEYLKLRRNYL